MIPRARTLLALFLLAACSPQDQAKPEAPPPAHVDSVFPIEEEIRRFRADLPDAPEVLGPGAADSRDELVARFVAALEAADTAAFRTMVVSRAEFAYLYYPHTRFTAAPYELSPALLWFQFQQNGEKGISRALQTYGGRDTGFLGYDCPQQPAVEGPNTLWVGCALRLRAPDGGVARKRLFGTILEREGRFKFLSFGNDL